MWMCSYFQMSELESIAGAFTDEMLGEVCAMMMEGGDAGMLKSLSDGGVDCLNHLDAADQVCIDPANIDNQKQIYAVDNRFHKTRLLLPFIAFIPS